MPEQAKEKIRELNISSSIFNTNKDETQYGDTRLFLGEPHGFFDTINKPHADIWALYKQMLSQAWDENEFDYSTCIQEFKSCSRGLYDAMIYNLAYQWEADSVAAQSIAPIASGFITNSELWACTLAVATNEVLHCLTPDHEVLTSEGWKYIDLVTVADRVAQWDYSTGEVTFVNPLQTMRYQYDGDMYRFGNATNSVNQLVTDQHRMPIVYPYWDSRNDRPQFKFAKDVNYHGGNALPVAGSLAPGRGMTPYERILVAVQADGSLKDERYTGERSGTIPYSFNLKRKDKVERLLALSSQAGLEARVYNSNKPGYVTVYIMVPVEMFEPRAKTFDWINYEKLNSTWGMDFLEEVTHWDGNVHDSGQWRYTNSNKAAIEKYATIAHLCGLRAHITVIPARTGAIMPGGRLSDTKESYQVYVSKRGYVPGNGFTKSVKHYQGDVFCLQVPTSFFLVRRNGCVSITGNSATYSEIVRCSFEQPGEVFGRILTTTESFQRLDELTKVLDEAHTASHKYALGMISEEEAYDAVLLFYVALYCLERIQFIASFAVTFAFGEVGMFVPIAKAIQKICQDEFEVHAELDRLVLRKELATERGRASFEKNKERIQQIVDVMLQSEIDWAEFLGSDGRELPGMTSEKLQQFAIFHAQPVYDNLGLSSPHERITKNPLPFTEDWMNINSIQASPQEEKGRSSSYLIGRISNRGKEEDFSFDDV